LIEELLQGKERKLANGLTGYFTQDLERPSRSWAGGRVYTPHDTGGGDAVKVSKQGTIPEPGSRPWYFEATSVCGYCGTEYNLEPGDAFQQIDGRTEDQGWVESACPTCGQVVRTDVPISWVTAPEHNV